MKNYYKQQLNWRVVYQLPRATQYLSALLLSCCVLLVGYWLPVRSKWIESQLLHEQQKQLQQQYESKQRQALLLPLYRNKFSDLGNQLDEILVLMLKKGGISELLQEISQTGQDSGLTIEQLTPLPEVTHKLYREHTINLVMRGNYQQLAIFLSRTNLLPGLITFHDFTLQPVKDSVLQMTLALRIYLGAAS